MLVHFFKVPSFTQYGTTDMIAYVKGTNILFINPVVSGSGPTYYGSMVIDNIKKDNATVISIYDVAMDGKNIYRLQQDAYYPGDSSDTAWAPLYNYQLSPLDSFVTSIAMSANPAVIAANGGATTTINAVVRDQFLQNINGKIVTFTDDDDTVGKVYKNSLSDVAPITATTVDGLATVIYRAGTTAREVKITAVVEQS
jgi:hypothetical protein